MGDKVTEVRPWTDHVVEWTIAFRKAGGEQRDEMVSDLLDLAHLRAVELGATIKKYLPSEDPIWEDILARAALPFLKKMSKEDKEKQLPMQLQSLVASIQDFGSDSPPPWVSRLVKRLVVALEKTSD